MFLNRHLFLLSCPSFLFFLYYLIVPLPFLPRVHKARQMQLTRPHLYPLLCWRRWYAHSMPRLPFPLQPLLLSLQIRLPSGFPLFDPVRALLQHGAPLENGLFTFGKTDCTAGFAVGFFGLFESLGTVGKGRGRHCRCCRGRSGGAADCGGPCVVLGM